MFRLVQGERRSLILTLVGALLFFGGLIVAPDSSAADLADAPLTAGVALCTVIMMSGGALWAIGVWPLARPAVADRAERLPPMAVPAVVGSGLALLVAIAIAARNHL